MNIELSPQELNFIIAALREFPVVVAKSSEDIIRTIAKQVEPVDNSVDNSDKPVDNS
jgi:polyhydroxyalkanoate synthesis regulator protein